ncbi:MAG: hypothetical protein IKD33_01560 [Bacteroidales bacterium]|nr:hypothetical protein [Bacteroidales bacterium]
MIGKGKEVIILLIIVVLGTNNCRGQIAYLFNDLPLIDSSEIKKLYLEVDVLSFFKNNEFTGEKVKGYTLPGFCMSPHLSLAFSKNVRMEVGANILRYWGSEIYPCYSYLGIAEWESERYQKGVHILPIMRAQFSITDSFHIVFGTLYNRNSHLLCTPLYNNELNYTSDRESGIQILYDNRFHSSDLWVNWQSFIFENDIHQEMFVFGYSSRTNIIKTDYGLEIGIPLQFVAQHRGGEVNIAETHSIQTYSNYAAGLFGKYSFGGKYFKDITFACYYIGFTQNVGTLYPFNNGWAIYPELSIRIHDFQLDMGYFVGKDFISLLGSPHFGNISAKTPDMIFDKMDMFMAEIEYCYHKSKYFSFGIEGSFIHYFPYTSFRPEYGTMERKRANSFSFGLFLDINPRIRIANLKPNIE